MLREDPQESESFGLKASVAQSKVKMTRYLLAKNTSRGKKNKGKSSGLKRDEPGIRPSEVELEDLEDLTPKEEKKDEE